MRWWVEETFRSKSAAAIRRSSEEGRRTAMSASPPERQHGADVLLAIREGRAFVAPQLRSRSRGAGSCRRR